MSLQDLMKSEVLVQTINEMSVEDWFAGKIKAVREVASTTSKLVPVLFGLNIDKEDSTKFNEIILNLSHFLENEHTKNIMSSILPTWLEQCGVFALCIVTESWKKNEKYEVVGEMITIIQETLSESKLLFMNFTRTPEGLIQPSNVEDFKGGNLSGRFIGLLNKGGDHGN